MSRKANNGYNLSVSSASSVPKKRHHFFDALFLAAISLVQSFDDFARDVVGGIAIEQVVKSGIAQDEVVLLLGIVNLDEVVD